MNKTIAAKTVLLACFIGLASLSTHAQPQASGQPQSPIPMDQLGAVAGKQYQGDGLAICTTPNGARLHCVFQRLEGEATTNGLWLRSTAEGSNSERLRVVAVEVGRVTPCASELSCCSADWESAVSRIGNPQPTASRRNSRLPTCATSEAVPALASAGIVNVADNSARFIRDGLIEEYSVSMDGVRQDFIIQQRPPGDGELRVELDVTGATADPLVNGARLTLNGSGRKLAWRKLAYTRLHVTDTSGRELAARIEATSASRLAVIVDDISAVYPVRIDPTFSDENWISMGGIPGADSQVLALALAGSDVYVGGRFTNAGGVVANRIAKWNGSSWSALGSGMITTVRALAVSGNDLYVGGDFTTATNTDGVAVTVNRIAKWNGSSWSALGSGLNGAVYALAVSSSDLYAGGVFTTATNSGGVAINTYRIAKWNGSSWSALGSGLNNIVQAIAVSGSDLYAGGGFTTATNSGGVALTVNRIAKWDGSSWSALGAGMSASVITLVISGNDLYVGGDFTTATNSDGVAVTANRIAKWDGSSWSALGSGLNSFVTAMAVSGNDLYAGGYFTTATNNGGVSVTVNYVAKWNGSSWSALGSGLNSVLSALAVSGSDLFAGGNFTAASGRAASRIAKWNGSSWSGLDSRLNNEVYALAVAGSDLYAGGAFTTAGGSAVNYIAKWNGSSWSALGLGMNSSVDALAVSGSDLYAGGTFTRATNSGGVAVTVNGIAKWNGNSWSALGSGMNYYVRVLAVSGSDLYAGGGFTTAGGKVSAYVAKANIGGNSSPGQFGSMVFSPATGFSFTFSGGSVGQPYRIQTSPSLAAGPWTDFTNFTYAGPIVITDANAVTGTNKFSRAVTP